MDLVHYGVIGCGMMGQEHLRNIALLPGCAVSAIYEPDAGMAAKVRALAPDAAMVPTLNALLERDDYDCLLIASPNFRHVEQMQAIAAARAVPLLVEKPLFTAEDDAAALRGLADRYTAPIWVAMEYRYMPVIAAFLEQARAVTGGIQMLTIREHRFPFLPKVGDWNRFNRYTGGTFVEKCCHFFDLMRLALGAEPVRVMASAGQAVNHRDERYDGAAPDILDHGYAVIEFDTGARAMLELCMFAEGSAYQEELSAVGPQGKIEAFVPGPGRFWPQDLGPAPVAALVRSPRAPKRPVRVPVDVEASILAAGDHNGATFFQHQRFVEMVRGARAQPDVSLWDGWMAVAMGQAAQHSAATGQAVAICADSILGNRG
ncbi:MAG: Gfo/Idh/MocA family oxidoreductase [Pseudomonadota bacterium]